MKESAKQTANAVTDYLNNFSRNKNSDFIEAMNTEHRTLQQDFTRLCLDWLEHCSKNDYPRDLRNEASHDISKKVIGKFKEDNDGISPSMFLPTY